MTTEHSSPVSMDTNGAAGPSPAQNGQQNEPPFRLKFCTVCASNQNRYVEPSSIRLYGQKLIEA